MRYLPLRVLSLLLAALLLCSLCACLDGEDELPSPLSEQTALSLSVLADQLGLGEATAMDILVQLRRAGFDEDIRMAFVGEVTDDGTNTFRIWLESTSVDVVIGADGLVSCIQSGDTVLYVQELSHTPPIVPPTDNDPPTGKPAEPTPDDPAPPVENPVENPDNSDPPQPNDPPESGGTAEKVLEIVSLTTPLEAGKTATLVAHGKAGEKYTISVRYASGESTAQGLEPQIADEDGVLRWSFRVASRVPAGEYPVTVSGGDETITVTLVVEE